MDSQSLTILQRLLEWRQGGWKAALATVLNTYGTSPRPAGSIAVIREDGIIAGSISGGCVEDVLTRHLQARWNGLHPLPACERLYYGKDEKEQNRLRLPCGKQVHVSVEYAPDLEAIGHIVQALHLRMAVKRTLRYADGFATWQAITWQELAADPRPALQGNDSGHIQVMGPNHRLILVGANDVASYMAPMALALDFQVTVCDPRDAFRHTWATPGTTLDHRMPDDLIRDAHCDVATAIVAVSHDPKLDDLALMEALATPCFYVGVVGSRASAPKRRERLTMLDVTPEQLNRLHSPAGLDIGSRTPPQIAVSVLAELIAAQRDLVPHTGRAVISSSACDLG